MSKSNPVVLSPGSMLAKLVPARLSLGKGNTFAFGMCFLILLINAWFLRFNAFRSFNFIDMGCLLDSAWRVHRGQLPYIDFIFIAGPIHLYLQAFFYALFGFGKASILAHLVAVSSIVIIVSFLITHKRTPLMITWVTTFFSAVSFYWLMSHPWYDQTAHLWGILGIGLLALRIPLTSARSAFSSGVVTGILVVFSIMSKTNIGIGYGAVFLVVLALSPQRAYAVGGYVAGGLVATCFMAWTVQSPKLFMEQGYMYGKTQRQRIMELFYLRGWMRNYYTVPVLIVALEAALYRVVRLQYLSLFFGVSWLGLYSGLTGSMTRECNIPLLGISIALAFVTIYKMKKESKLSAQRTVRRLGSAGVVALFMVTLYFTAVSIKRSVDLKVWAFSGRDPIGEYSIKAEPLKGWKCHEEIGRCLDDFAVIIEEHIPKNETLLILTNMMILYPLTNRDSYRNIPYVLSTFDNIGLSEGRTRAAILNNPPDWIIAQWMALPGGISVSGSNYLFERLDIWDFIQSSYRKAVEVGPFILLKRTPKDTSYSSAAEDDPKTLAEASII